MSFSPMPFWKEAPFIRLVIPLAAGILVQWYVQLNPGWLWYGFILSIICLIIFLWLHLGRQFRIRWIQGFFMHIILFTTGSLLIHYKNIVNNPHWISHIHQHNDLVLAEIDEPLIEKPASYKALASIKQLRRGNGTYPVKGQILIYFKKDSSVSKLFYGVRIMFNKPLQGIKKSGNPGGFDYRAYCVKQGIHHQLYLSPEDYIILPTKRKKNFTSWLFSCRKKLVKILKTFIPGKKESGLAEALLIGYKDDLDKDLLQSYSNTGVVHIIAISGLHLGIIYLLLIRACSLFRIRQKLARALIVLISLWTFTFLVGASPSVLRSAVMFSFILIGECMLKKALILNSLAASAFVLLCINPFWIWDVGFQLSYAAVISLVILMKPIYNIFFIPNPILDNIWKLTAVTLSAQILTLPVTLYYFHQFPNYFLLTNLVAVPLSSIVLIMLIVLSAISFVPTLAAFLGIVISWLITCMNKFIEYAESLPFSTWEYLQLNILQVICLYIFLTAICYWLMQEKKSGLAVGLLAVFLFVLIRSHSFYQSAKQVKLIVYNIPKHQAIDIIRGRKCTFLGDEDLIRNNSLVNYHLKPSRILYRISDVKLKINEIPNNFFLIANKKMLILDGPVNHLSSSPPISVDFIILSKNPPITIQDISQHFQYSQIIFDASNSSRNINSWSKQCEKSGIPYYNVVDKGAFVMNLN